MSIFYQVVFWIVVAFVMWLGYAMIQVLGIIDAHDRSFKSILESLKMLAGIKDEEK